MSVFQPVLGRLGQWRIQEFRKGGVSSVIGARIDAPKGTPTPNLPPLSGLGGGEGVSPPHWGWGGDCFSPENFWTFYLEIALFGAF